VRILRVSPQDEHPSRHVARHSAAQPTLRRGLSARPCASTTTTSSSTAAEGTQRQLLRFGAGFDVDSRALHRTCTPITTSASSVPEDDGHGGPEAAARPLRPSATLSRDAFRRGSSGARFARILTFPRPNTRPSPMRRLIERDGYAVRAVAAWSTTSPRVRGYWIEERLGPASFTSTTQRGGGRSPRRSGVGPLLRPASTKRRADSRCRTGGTIAPREPSLGPTRHPRAGGGVLGRHAPPCGRVRSRGWRAGRI
jgi:hypothetical protein